MESPSKYPYLLKVLSKEDPTSPPVSPCDDEDVPFPLPIVSTNGNTLSDMSREELRTFISTLVKYTTGRSRPGWGLESTKPDWWPTEIPWSSIQVDRRTARQKRKRSWPDALRQVVRSCYEYYGRQDLLKGPSRDLKLSNSRHRHENDQNSSKVKKSTVNWSDIYFNPYK